VHVHDTSFWAGSEKGGVGGRYPGVDLGFLWVILVELGVGLEGSYSYVLPSCHARKGHVLSV
jgi:hypothetical protein